MAVDQGVSVDDPVESTVVVCEAVTT